MTAFYAFVIAFPQGRARAAVLEKIGKYEIRLQVGRGGMGVVYEGFDPSIGRRVAIKTLRTENIEPEHLPEFLARFKREAQSAGRLSHPNIVTIYEYGEQDGMPYIVMEYINGRDLAADLKRGVRFSLDDVVRIMTQLLGALQHAHEQGVVHRDIKPPNVLVLDDGSLKVVDFGIARIEDSEAFTKTGAVMGTPAYMSPEQILGLPVTAKTDLFSAGTLLYQLLTGDRPFTGDEYSIKQKVLKHLPMAPSELNPLLAAPWDAVVARAMAKKPEARYDSARQFLESIRAAHEAERRGGEEARRKAAEAEEHARRGSEERSREEARQREELARREIERKEREESAALAKKKNAEDKVSAEAARRKADETVAIPAAPRPASRKSLFLAIAAVAAIAILGVILYQRDDSAERAAKAEAARSTEERARLQAEHAAKAAEGRAAEATRETQRLTQAQADERTRLEGERVKKESEEKAKAEALKKEDEAKRKTELAVKLAADLQARKDTEAKANQEADEKAKVDAARKVEEAKREAQRPGRVFRDCEGCPEMVAIPAGSFTMGSPDSEEGRDNDEGPQRRVSIARSFAAGRYEVTFDEWDACVRESGCSHNPGDAGRGGAVAAP